MIHKAIALEHRIDSIPSYEDGLENTVEDICTDIKSLTLGYQPYLFERLARKLMENYHD